MIEKTEFYHGAALVRLLEDARCKDIKKKGLLGYLVNDSVFVFLKYTTKARTPWGFTFDKEDTERCFRMASEYDRVVLGLVCGGDGICAIDWEEARHLIDHKPGRIAVGRKHHKRYGVWGTVGELSYKTPLNRWPALVFESSRTMRNNRET